MARKITMERKPNMLLVPSIVVPYIVEQRDLLWEVLPLEIQNGIHIRIHSARRT